MKKQQKIEVVEKLKEKLSKAKSLVLSDYRGLTHQQMEQIKKALRQAQGEFFVAKNTLLKKSIPEAKYQIPDADLTGPTAALISYNDEISPLSVLSKFIKNFGLPKIKIGVINNKVYGEKEVLEIASLPSKEILMTTLISKLKSPIFRLNYGLNYNMRKLALILKSKGKS